MISDRDLQQLIAQAQQNDEGLRLCAQQLQKLTRSQDATTDQLKLISSLLGEMNKTIDSQNQRIAGNSQDIAKIKRKLGI